MAICKGRRMGQLHGSHASGAQSGGMEGCLWWPRHNSMGWSGEATCNAHDGLVGMCLQGAMDAHDKPRCCNPEPRPLCLPQLCDGVLGARSASAPFSAPDHASCMGGRHWQKRRSACPCSSCSSRHSSGALLMVGRDGRAGFGQAVSTMAASMFAAKT